jgi:hypothetical protein
VMRTVGVSNKGLTGGNIVNYVSDA